MRFLAMPQLVALPMRCAAKGGRFYAVFEWDELRCEYVLAETVLEKTETPGLAASMESEDRTGKSLLSEPSRTVGRLFEGGQEDRSGTLPTARENEATKPARFAAGTGALPQAEESQPTFNLSEFNFSGFSCPLCGYGEKVPFTQGTLYFQCGRCHELVCGVRVREVRGSLTYRCTNKCGARGTFSNSASDEEIIATGIVGEFETCRPSPPDLPELPSPRQPRIAENDGTEGRAIIGLPPPKPKR
jgi:hypothetical protein